MRNWDKDAFWETPRKYIKLHFRKEDGNKKDKTSSQTN